MKDIIVIALIVLSKVIGDVCLSHGMQQVGELTVFQFAAWLDYGFRILTNLWVDLGMGLELLFFLLWMAALSWLDLSYMLPLTASTYVLTALFAKFFLQEPVQFTRWLGTAAIALGVLLVSLSDYQKSAPALNSSERAMSERSQDSSS